MDRMMARFSFTMLVHLCFVLGVGVVLGAPEDAVVESLPGWSGKLPSQHYSGYVNVTQGRMHYVFAESENDCAGSAGTAADVPLVLWVQGGPGCSSLLGFFEELGTFTIHRSHDDTLQLALNPYRWSRCAHMLYWESPIGVGFSYSPTHDYKTNDTRVADTSLEFLLNWFKLYPEYRTTRLYLAGESYGGIYIPMLSSLILEHNAKAEEAAIPLSGVMVGNGCTGRDIGACSSNYDLEFAMPYMHGHALISDDLYYTVQDRCGQETIPKSADCVEAVNNAYKAVGNINIDDILSPCVVSNGSGGADRDGDHHGDENAGKLLRRRRLSSIHGLPGCVFGLVTQAYMRSDAVQRALHVVPRTALSPWQGCSDAMYNFYHQTAASVLDRYAEIVGRQPILIYDGDADLNVPFTDNKRWTADFAEAHSLRPQVLWEPWLTLTGQVGGYWIRYERDFTFATVRGAGHEVPQYKPEAAFSLFRYFITRGSLPRTAQSHNGTRDAVASRLKQA